MRSPCFQLDSLSLFLRLECLPSGQAKFLDLFLLLRTMRLKQHTLQEVNIHRNLTFAISLMANSLNLKSIDC